MYWFAVLVCIHPTLISTPFVKLVRSWWDHAHITAMYCDTESMHLPSPHTGSASNVVSFQPSLCSLRYWPLPCICDSGNALQFISASAPECRTWHFWKQETLCRSNVERLLFFAFAMPKLICTSHWMLDNNYHSEINQCSLALMPF